MSSAISAVKSSKKGTRFRLVVIAILAVVVGLAGVGVLVGAFVIRDQFAEGWMAGWLYWAAAGAISAILLFTAQGLWRKRNWARTVLTFAILGYLAFLTITLVFAMSTQIFAGEHVMGGIEILQAIWIGLRWGLIRASGPVLLYLFLRYAADDFIDSVAQREFVDSAIRYLLLATGVSAVIIVLLIIIFTVTQAWPAIEEIGLGDMLTGTVWRPNQDLYGLVPMVLGTVLSTLGAAIIGVPLSIGTAILLAEVAPQGVRKIMRPAIELLAGIPSVVFGLFGMVVIAPLVRQIDVSGNSGFGLLTASVVLALMIMPTITNVAEDAIRAVPQAYKEGSLALGATHWQTIMRVMVPAGRSGVLAAIILGIGRALGETMALIMVIGNAIAIPGPLNNNPFTVFLSAARTLTGNIAVEINYAAGVHRSALFFTGVLLFVMILLVNSLARYMMKEKH